MSIVKKIRGLFVVLTVTAVFALVPVSAQQEPPPKAPGPPKIVPELPPLPKLPDAKPKPPEPPPEKKAIEKEVKKEPEPPRPKKEEKKEAKKEKKEERMFKSFNFKDIELNDLIVTVSTWTGRNFILDEKVRGKVTIVSPTEIPYDSLWTVFESVLRVHGYQVVSTGTKNLYKVIRLPEVKSANIPTYLGARYAAPSDSFVTRLVPLKHIKVQDVVGVLSQLKSPEGLIIPYPATNTLIVIESTLNLNRLIRILEQMDVPMESPEIKIIRLNYAPADQVSNQLSQIFADSGTTGPKPPPRPPRPGKKPPLAPPGGGKGATFKIISDQRTNSLIIIAMPEMINQMYEIIVQLDIPIDGGEGIYVYYLENADATELAGTLSSLSGGGGGPRPPPRPPLRPPLTPPLRPPPPKTPITFGGATTGLGAFEGEVRITADEPTNSLVIIASKRDYDVIKRVIAKLDIRRKQVFVEAVILEIRLVDNKGVGFSYSAATAIDDNAVAFGNAALGPLNSLGLLPSIAAASATGDLSSAIPSGFTAGIVGRTVKVDIGGVQIDIPIFSALFNAFITETDVNILSTPNLLTMDNEEAEIFVGMNIPIPTGQSTGTGGVTTSTIQRQDIGIKLKLTPQISESNTIKLKILTEISGAEATSVGGIDVNVFGITTTKKTAETTIVVDDGQTVVIGGLIQDTLTVNVSKIPILGDIPILGWFFRHKSTEKRKTNLVILLTPHIIRNRQDLEKAKNYVGKRRDKHLIENMGDKYIDSIYHKRYYEKYKDWEEVDEDANLIVPDKLEKEETPPEEAAPEETILPEETSPEEEESYIEKPAAIVGPEMEKEDTGE